MGEQTSDKDTTTPDSVAYSEAMIDKVLEDSFPASDPPAWTSGADHADRPRADDANRPCPAEDESGRDARGDEPAEAGDGSGREPSPGASAHHASADGAIAIYHGWTRKALYERARTLEIQGRSRMSKAELVKAIRRLVPEH